ncbi:hypothetical protein ACTXNJ_25110, partial [Pseudomonas helleri]
LSTTNHRTFHTPRTTIKSIQNKPLRIKKYTSLQVTGHAQYKFQDFAYAKLQHILRSIFVPYVFPPLSPTAFTDTLTRSQWLEHAQDFNGRFFTPTRSTGQPG